MADILSETVDPEDLKRLEKVYHEQLHTGSVTKVAQFEYAWCLVRSKYPADIKKGIVLLEELFHSDEEGRRDYVYYLAVGHARMKEYRKAINYTKSFLEIEPGNSQVLNLHQIIQKKMEKEALVGIGVASGAVLAVGAILGAGFAIASHVKK